MWRTRDGARVLTEAEATLVREAIAEMVRNIAQDRDIDDHWRYGVPVFDDLSPVQRLLMLLRVGSSLLLEDAPELPHTAVNEGTAAAILECISQCIQMELDNAGAAESFDWETSPHRFFWRKSLRAIFDVEELTTPETGAVLQAECDEWNEWDICLAVFHDRILWDQDYLMEAVFVDSPPETAGHVKSAMDIPRDYFTAFRPIPRTTNCRPSLPNWVSW